MTPAVSVIIPMRNAEPYILQTLDSLLIEKEIPIEVLIVDDNSSDCSVAKIRTNPDPRIVLIRGTRPGIAPSFNAGLARSRGKIIMRCDADDLYPRDRIQTQVQWLQSHQNFAAIAGKFTAIDHYGKFVREFCNTDKSCDITDELRAGVTRTSFCTFAARAEILHKIGGFRDFFITGEDIDCQLRIAEQGNVWFEDAVCYLYRLHDASIVHQQHNELRQFFDDIARSFQKQRQDEGSDALQNGTPPLPPRNLRNNVRQTASSHIQGLLLGKAWEEHSDGHRFKAIKTGIAAIRYQLNNWAAWKSVLALLVKNSSRLVNKQ